MRSERLPEPWTWWRIADPAWRNPLDPTFAQRRGGRWNPPASYPTLYFNEDRVTARANLRSFIARWPYEPEDLRDDTGPVLIGATLPRAQTVCDAHTNAGLKAIGLPMSYPLDGAGRPIAHPRCQAIGERAKNAGPRGVRARSASGSGRELAWFPATARSVARALSRLPFGAWYWG